MINPGSTATAVFEYGGTEPIAITYQWYLNGEAVNTNGTSESFFVPMNAAGKTIRVVVTLTNSEGAMTRQSTLYTIEGTAS